MNVKDIKELCLKENKWVIDIFGVIFVPSTLHGQKVVRDGNIGGRFLVDQASYQEKAGQMEYVRCCDVNKPRRMGTPHIIDSSLTIIDGFLLDLNPLPPQELTVEEISKKLGYPVKVVANKK